MARVTIEKALSQCESKFELVVLASYRAHAIAYGDIVTVNNNNRFAILALREIEAGNISIDNLRKTVIDKYIFEQKNVSLNNSFIVNDLSVNKNMTDKENNTHIEMKKGENVKLVIENKEINADFFK